jgi:hypothetical protein
MNVVCITIKVEGGDKTGLFCVSFCLAWDLGFFYGGDKYQLTAKVRMYVIFFSWYTIQRAGLQADVLI